MDTHPIPGNPRFPAIAVAAVLVFLLASIGPSAMARGRGATQQLVIESVQVDLDQNTLTIQGQNLNSTHGPAPSNIWGVEFEVTRKPAVTLDGEALVVESHTAEMVVAQMPDHEVTAGDYLLTVSTGATVRNHDSWSLTVGTVGPQGEPGPPGPPGTTSWTDGAGEVTTSARVGIDGSSNTAMLDVTNNYASGAAIGVTGVRYGVYATASSTAGDALLARATATSGPAYAVNAYTGSSSGIGVYAGVNGTGWGMYTPDNLYVGGSITGAASALLALNSSAETLRVGDVVAVAGVGATLRGHLQPLLEVSPARAGDVAVLGIVHSRGELQSAHGDRAEDGDRVHPVPGDVESNDYLLVVTSGLVQVRVELGLDSLTPGRKLTAAAVPGQATLAPDGTAPDLVLGRAMEAYPDENGLVWTLISAR